MPASIQLVHAFEQHEHVICTSEIEHHIHQDDIECALCHLQAESHLVLFNNRYDVIPVTFYQSYNDDKPQEVFQVHLSKKSSRAPPYFTV